MGLEKCPVRRFGRREPRFQWDGEEPHRGSRRSLVGVAPSAGSASLEREGSESQRSSNVAQRVSLPVGTGSVASTSAQRTCECHSQVYSQVQDQFLETNVAILMAYVL